MRLSRFGKGLMVSGAVALVTPAAFAGLLAGATLTNSDMVVTDDVAQPAPQRKTADLDRLGRANAVAWISAGHVSAAS